MTKMTDITPILDLVIRLIATLISIFLLPKLAELMKAKASEADQKKIIRWAELAVQAAEEAERSGLIDKKAKYDYAVNILECYGVTFDAATMQTLIDSTCWELFNKFKKESTEGGSAAGTDEPESEDGTEDEADDEDDSDLIAGTTGISEDDDE